jgi:uncharacterized protein YodC (DUF2158 family)
MSALLDVPRENGPRAEYRRAFRRDREIVATSGPRRRVADQRSCRWWNSRGNTSDESVFDDQGNTAPELHEGDEPYALP